MRYKSRTCIYSKIKLLTHQVQKKQMLCVKNRELFLEYSKASDAWCRTILLSCSCSKQTGFYTCHSIRFYWLSGFYFRQKSITLYLLFSSLVTIIQIPKSPMCDWHCRTPFSFLRGPQIQNNCRTTDVWQGAWAHVICRTLKSRTSHIFFSRRLRCFRLCVNQWRRFPVDGDERRSRGKSGAESLVYSTHLWWLHDGLVVVAHSTICILRVSRQCSHSQRAGQLSSALFTSSRTTRLVALNDTSRDTMSSDSIRFCVIGQRRRRRVVAVLFVDAKRSMLADTVTTLLLVEDNVSTLLLSFALLIIPYL